MLDREAVEFFLRTRAAIFPGMTIAQIFDVREGPLYEEMRRNILHINGADHTRLRSLVNPALSPRAVERYRPVMRELLEDSVAGTGRGAGGRGAGADTPERRSASTPWWRSVDGARGAAASSCGDVAKPYPSQAIAHVMGAPLEDAPRLHHWSNWIQRQFDAISMTEQKPAIEQAVSEFYEYAWGLVRARREQPRRGPDLAADRRRRGRASGSPTWSA